MASIRRLPSGKWNVRISRKGYPLQTKSFLNRIDADRWARTIESEMDRGCFVCRSEPAYITMSITGKTVSPFAVLAAPGRS